MSCADVLRKNFGHRLVVLRRDQLIAYGAAELAIPTEHGRELSAWALPSTQAHTRKRVLPAVEQNAEARACDAFHRGESAHEQVQAAFLPIIFKFDLTSASFSRSVHLASSTVGSSTMCTLSNAWRDRLSEASNSFSSDTLLEMSTPAPQPFDGSG